MAHKSKAKAVEVPKSDKKKAVDLEPKLWQDFAGEEVVKTVSSKELKRQEVIYELIQSERDYLRDLELTKTHFWSPIEKGMVEVSGDRQEALKRIFGNLKERIAAHRHLLGEFKSAQEKSPVFSNFGSVFLKNFERLNMYVEYNTNYIRSKSFISKELEENSSFHEHHQNKLKHADLRKLPLESFLSIGITRLPRYKLYLEAIISKTEPSDPDLPCLMALNEKLGQLLERIDVETGKASNLLQLEELSAALQLKKNQSDEVVADLDLLSPSRILFFSGILERAQDLEADDIKIRMYVLDNFLVLVEDKEQKDKKKLSLKLFCNPIPMELVEVLDQEQFEKRQQDLSLLPSKVPSHSLSPEEFKTAKIYSTLSTPRARAKSSSHLSDIPTKSKTNFTWTAQALQKAGKNKKEMVFVVHSLLSDQYHVLSALNPQEKATWLKSIERARQCINDKRLALFRPRTLGKPWELFHRITFAAKYDDPISKHEAVFIATDQGVFMGIPNPDGTVPKFEFIIKAPNVQRIRMKKGVDHLFLLAGEPQRIYSIPFIALHTSKKPMSIRPEYKIRHTSGTTHFMVGSRGVRHFLCCARVKGSISSATRSVHILELSSSKKSFGFKSNVIKEIELRDEPSSLRLDLFPNALCTIGISNMQIIDFSTGMSREIRPRASESSRSPRSPRRIFKLPEGELFLCFLEMGVYMNDKCEPSRTKMIKWSGNPSNFALRGHFVLAFSALFVEVHDLRTGDLAQILSFSNITLISDNDDTNQKDSILATSLVDGKMTIQHIHLLDSPSVALSSSAGLLGNPGPSSSSSSALPSSTTTI